MNKNTPNIRTLALSVCIGLAVTGCGSQQTKPVAQMSATEKAQFDQIQDQAQKVLDDVIKALTTAEKNNVPTFSQIYYPEAKSDLKKLKDMHKEFNPDKSGIFDSGYTLNELKEQAQLASGNTKKAVKTKELITTHFKDILDNQEYIEGLDLSKFTSTYKGHQSDVKDLFKDLEKAGQLQGLESKRLTMLNNLKQFEITVIKDKYYDQPFAELEKLPKSTVPVTYGETEKRLNTLAQTIETSPRDMETIELHQKEVLKALTRTQNTLKEINWIDENTSKGLEHIVLHYHKPMDRAFPEILKEDHSELLFEDQVSKYSFLVTSLKSDIEKQVSSMDESTIKAEAQKIADQKAEELRNQLGNERAQEQQKQNEAHQKQIADAIQKETLKHQESEKKLKEQHTLAFNKLSEDKEKLQLDYEKIKLELNQLKEQQRLEALAKTNAPKPAAVTQTKEANQQEKPATTAQELQVVETVKEVKVEKVVEEKAEAAQEKVVETVVETVVEKEVEVPAKPTTLGFDFEIEEVEL